MNKKYNNKDQKVICIGMHKTGTSTLGYALDKLSYSVVGARLDMTQHLLKNNIDVVLEEASKYDALQDVPWAVLYDKLDQKYPGSKFILTERNEDQWIKSVINHFGKLDIDLHRWIYGEGTALGNELIYLDKYRRHNKEVKEYFKNRPNDLLIFSLNDNGWNELCEFLNCKVPPVEFPHANKGIHNLSKKEKIISKIKKTIPVSWRGKIMRKLGYSNRSNIFNNYKENQKYMRDNLNL